LKVSVLIFLYRLAKFFIPISECLKGCQILIEKIVSGIPPVVYLTMNKTIQRDCFKTFKETVNTIKQFYKSLHSNAIQPLIHQINFVREHNQVTIQNQQMYQD